MRLRREPDRPLLDDLLDVMILENGIKPDRNLQAISAILTANGQLLDLVLADLGSGLKEANKGRRGLTAQQTLHVAVLMRIFNWTYREASDRISDSLYLRKFTGFPFGCPLPKTDAINRAVLRLTPATIEALNQVLVGHAIERGVEDGARVRVDTTVVDTDIHYPTDSSLLWDSVRKLTALMGKVQERVPDVQFPNRTKRAKRLDLRIVAAGKRRTDDGAKQRKKLYQQLMKVTREVARQARSVAALVPETSGDLVAVQLAAELQSYAKLTEQVINQTTRRINKGETVPATEKILSIFEPHTAVIRRGKVEKPVEFGRKVLLQECGSGLISSFEILDGNPNDSTHVSATLDRHEQIFGKPPKEYAADRGFFSSENLECAKQRAVSVCSIPKPGYRSAETEERESTREFRKGQRWRPGIEGTISALKRGRGMGRCLWNGDRGFKLFVGLSVLANNLMVLAANLN